MTMIYAGIDIETTGLLEPEHRIIELYIEIRKNLKTIFGKTYRFDPKRSITAEAQRVHGIDLAMLAGENEFSKDAPTIAKILERPNIIIAHNGEWFDWPFMKMEGKRVGVPMPEINLFDTMVNGRWATPDGKSPSLGELCFSTGVGYDPSAAHAADYDVKVNLDAFERGVQMGFFNVNGLKL